MPTVFVSASSGEDDQYVEDLFRDLRRRLATLTGEPERHVAVLGRASSDARAWPREVAEGLARSHVFLALQSPRYRLNAVCGRQFWVFNDRLDRYEREFGVRPQSLISVAWTLADAALGMVPSVDAPPVIVPEHGGVRRGLRQLIRLRDLRESYVSFVDALAATVVAAAEEHPLPEHPAVPDLTDTPNAFAPEAAVADTSGPHIHFAVAAGTRDEMQEVRDVLVFYGPASTDWAPYRPSLSRSLAEHARTVAADHLFESAVGSVDDVIDRIERARRDNEIVVVLVDWWTTQLHDYQRVLAAIDERGLGATAVLVPASRTDAETAENREELRFGLRRTFRNATSQPDAMFRSEIDTPDQFDADLAAVLAEARNRIYREADVRYAEPGEPIGDRPLLSGP
ncbi:MAG TPA: FxsC protein [Micromonosporaceae bacterium]|nr:FxsC protein [Micromonosporaceae bacterium]